MKGLLIAWMGCHSIVAQVTLIREFLVVSYGHELCLGVVFASWLIGIFVGNWLGGRFQGLGKGGLGTFVGWQSVCVLVACASVVEVRLLRSLLPSGPGVPLPLATTVLSALAVVTPLGVAVGTLFPFGCSMMASLGRRSFEVIGRVYVLEALGMLLGGLSFTFLLLPRMDHLGILAAVGLGTLVTATVVMIREKGSRSGLAMAVGSVCWAMCWALGGIAQLQQISIEERWRAMHPGLQRIAGKESLYQSVELGNLDGQFSVFGNGQLLSTFPDPHGAAFSVHLLMNQDAKPGRLLVVGGGPGSMLPLLLRYPVREVHLAELDPLVFDIASPYFPTEIARAIKDSRVQMSFVDARYLVRKLPPGAFDAVVLQVPDPSTALLSRYHTVEFFRDLKRIMTTDGVLMTSIIGSTNYLGDEMLSYAGTIYRTLGQVFPEVVLVPGERAIFLASSRGGGVTLDPGALSKEMELQGVRDPYFPAEAFSYWIQSSQVNLWRRSLESYHGEVNRDAHPLSLIHYLMLWELISGEKWGWSLLRHLKGLNLGWLLVLLTATTLLYLVAGRQDRAQRSRLMVIALTGFSGMAQEILCLYIYQAAQGYLYSRVAVMIALFMGGLAAGGWLGSQLSSLGPKWASRGLSFDQGFLLLLCLAVPLGWVPLLLDMPTTSWNYKTLGVALGTWMFLAGAGTGAAFPMVCAALGPDCAPPGDIAGRAGAADHLGAALGALLPASILIPLLGLARTGGLLAAVQGTALLLVLLNLLDRWGVYGINFVRKKAG